jgi:lipopolysaccharide export system ATP-binding protein
MIVGLVEQDGGEIFIGTENITNLPMHGRAQKGIGYLPQEASVFRKMTVVDNILSILETRHDIDDVQRKAKTENLLEEFHLSHIRNSIGLSLSGGERRRVEIARALATEPDFILLDEPFAGVDPISVNEIKQIIRQLKSKNIGILITDHNVRETLDICEHAYIVGEGKVIAEGEASTIVKNQQVRDIYLGENFVL